MPRSGSSLRTISTAPRNGRAASTTRSSETTSTTGEQPLATRGVECVREQRAAAQQRERLGRVAAEAHAAPGGENDRGKMRVQIASSARRTSTCARCVRYSGDAFRSEGGSVPTAASRAASAAVAPWASAVSTAVARSGVEPMLTSATWVPPFTRVATAPTIAQSWARRLNFSYANPAGAALADLDLGEQLVGRERGLEEPLEELGRRDRTRPARTLHHERGVEREQRRGKIARGIAVRDRTADRAAVAHLVVADLGRDRAQHTALLGEHVAGLEIAVTGQRADREVIAGVAHVREVAHPADVDEHRRRREPQLHERQQRHAAREELRVLAVLADQRDRLGGRTGPHVVERGGDHFAPCIVSAAASTDFTMLW